MKIISVTIIKSIKEDVVLCEVEETDNIIVKMKFAPGTGESEIRTFGWKGQIEIIDNVRSLKETKA